ncbi:Acetyltransferase (GNAT) family protein [Streptomyces sp. YIM 121038]|uniref:GNAT family N-acetyltransferase n=1 Tax=Streptomyces sp. YIM 121038 TaxID=2136401 RepID=UPI00111003D6|nr:GNAT family N-acetyltransferase [Streptomyces sp. YIM 121038]QCX80397.1 Acetyltransferase (GNAT) family protein [Streptomyces sp. YIM 121038]
MENPAPGQLTPEQHAPGRLALATATPDDWRVVTGWAADEGWNPGLRDAESFFAQDPEGFFVGRVDGEPVSAVSVVNYGPAYAFLGFYLVRPDARGQGHGIATWRAALAHAGDRTVGLDGVPAQQDNYRRSGFAHRHDTMRYVGPAAVGGPVSAHVRPAAEVGHEALLAYDSSCYPADRPRFLASWLGTPGHRALARVDGGRVTGYGVVRPARDGVRIGPLFADTRADAEALLDALTAGLDGALVSIDVPESHAPAVALAEARGMKPTFATARMYTGPVREFAREKVFGITTLELG